MKRTAIHAAVVVMGLFWAVAPWKSAATSQRPSLLPGFSLLHEGAITVSKDTSLWALDSDSTVGIMTAPHPVSALPEALQDSVALANRPQATTADVGFESVFLQKFDRRLYTTTFQSGDPQGISLDSEVRNLLTIDENSLANHPPQGGGVAAATPSTYVAGVLLLLPFALTTLRILRRRRAP